MSMLLPIDNFHLYARANIREKLYSNHYQMPTLIRALGLKGGADELLPDELVVVGKRLDIGEREKFSSGTQFVWRWQATDTDDSKVVGYNSTGSTATDFTHENLRSAQVSMFELETPCRVENHVLEAAGNQAMPHAAAGDKKKAGSIIGSVIGEATAMKTATHLNNMNGRVYSGTPTVDDADIYDNLVGVDTWLDDANTIATVDRSLAINANFRAQKTTTAQNVTLAWIDKVIETGVTKTVGTTEPLSKWGSKADLLITGPTLFNKLKQEFVSRHVYIAAPELKQGKSWLGTINNYFQYGDVTVVLDQAAPASSVRILDSGTWLFVSMRMLDMVPFVNLRTLRPGAGEPNVTTSAISTKCQLICLEPKKNFLATNCS
jgi:hypothetical protein